MAAEGQVSKHVDPPAKADVQPTGPEMLPEALPQDRLAAIDIGSNSIRLVVACPLQGGQFRIGRVSADSSGYSGGLTG